jgi:hypothetical protein
MYILVPCVTGNILNALSITPGVNSTPSPTTPKNREIAENMENY